MPDLSRRTALLSLGGAALTGTLALAGAAPAVAAPSAQPNRAITVYLVRHGRTWLNQTGRIQGWSDSPLTDAGRATAEAVGRNLAAEIGGFDAAYSADMMRHFETASGILSAAGSSLTPTRVAGLREVAYGGWEGEKQSTAFPQLAAAGPLDTLAHIIDAFVASNPDKSLAAETWAQVAARMKDALTAAATDRTLPMRNGGSILAVSSGMSITCLLESLGATVDGAMENGAVNKLRYARGSWTVLSVNDTSYAG
ncbi:histidine phosphatase family protein [Microbacterium sp. NPDC089698]|jgi:probable phosphoglycerate mutase|uniref:histidine phosphatase family protein n=1 Tax=unclassified Microbacterium TaxID=2609290 RepID=UPI00283972CA|nr:histidine phosphatase family protein [Microbacterium sp.]MDR2322047.1 histidine phosphatase family protein [Microbacterium sp.]